MAGAMTVFQSVARWTIQVATKPSRTPIRPPERLSTMASIRNCTRMSRLRAPMAMRMPISRVRSVTETSMMFMMPMPPTSSEMLAMEASRMVSTLVVSSAVLAMSVWLRTVKSSSSPSCDLVGVAQDGGDLGLGLGHLLQGRGADQDLVDVRVRRSGGSSTVV